MNFIILGDKFQKRMKSRGCIGLVNIDNKTILEHQYNNIKKSFPAANIIYVYGFEGKRFDSFIEKNNKRLSINKVYNPNYNKFNHAYSLYLIKNFLNDSCCILFGDNLINYRVFNNFNLNSSQIFINKKQKHPMGCIINDSKITNISYDLENYLSDIYYLSKQHAIILQKLINNTKMHNYFIFELFNTLIDYNQDIYPYFVDQKSKLLTNEI